MTWSVLRDPLGQARAAERDFLSRNDRVTASRVVRGGVRGDRRAYLPGPPHDDDACLA